MSGARRALLVGAQTGGLRGVDEDVRRMARALGERGFAIDARTGADASRAGILDGIERLLRDTRPGDAAWLYYSGHGARAAAGTDVTRAIGRPAAREIRFLVPTDHAAGGFDDFRGITTWELSLRLASLTEASGHVTIVLDCCHAARIVRGEPEEPRARGLPDPRGLGGVARHLAALRAAGARFDRLDPLGNPRAVRLFASAESGYAWESAVDGVWCGALTDALVQCLERAGGARGEPERPITWSALAAVLRERVQRRFADQHPEVAGPSGRALFSCDEPAARRPIGVVVRGDRAVIRTGRVAGACVGDVYDLIPFASPADEDAEMVARATLETVDDLEATASIGSWRAGTHATDDLLAYARQQARPPFTVRFVGDAEARQQLAEVPWLRVVRADEPWLVTVELRGDDWTVTDLLGPLRAPVPRADGLACVVEILADLAAADALRRLEGTREADTGGVDVTLCRSSDDRPLAAGELLSPGTRFDLHVDSRASAPLHVHVFEIAPHGAITRITRDAALGLPLAPGSRRVIGGADAGPAGIPVRWPDGLPSGVPRELELVVIAASQPIELGFLERRVYARPRVTRTGPRPRDLAAPATLASRRARLGYSITRLRYSIATPPEGDAPTPRRSAQRPDPARSPARGAR